MSDTPPTDQAPTPEGEPDTFSREYVQDLRGEAAKYRTESKPFKDAFEGFKPEETQRFLDLAKTMVTDPAKAREEFQGVADRLAAQLGQIAAPPQSGDTLPSTQESGDLSNALGQDQVERMIAAAIDKQRRDAAAAQETQAIYDEALGLGPQYAKGSPEFAHLVATARTDPEAGGTLTGAHTVITKQLEAVAAKAVEDFRLAIQDGTAPQRYPAILPKSEPIAGESAGHAETLGEARARMEERIAAAFE